MIYLFWHAEQKERKKATEQNQTKQNQMKTFLVTFSIYVLAIAVGVKVTTDTLEAKTQSECFNSGNPYSRSCLYLSSRCKWCKS